MESVIKWRTGEPKENGWYLISIEPRFEEFPIDFDLWCMTEDGRYCWCAYENNEVIAWCPLSEIEPYKE